MSTVSATALPQKNNLELYIGLAVGIPVVVLCVCVFIIILGIFLRRRRKKYKRLRGDEKPKPPKDSGRKDRDSERKKLAEKESSGAVEVISQFNQEREEEYKIDERHLPELGSRLQKYWFRGHYRDSTEVLVTEAPLSKHCRLTLNRGTLEAINSYLLCNLRMHQFIHPIIQIHYNSQAMKVLTVQPLIARGSLRDYIFQESSPLLDWSKKYTKSSRTGGLPVEKIALFGKQTLEAMAYLYKQGFPLLGHVHTGNIFIVSEDCCKLGGYENTLLGYRTRIYRECVKGGYLNSIDIIMFGRVVCEMGNGREPEGVLPQERDYADMEDRVKQVVSFIFTQRNQPSFKPIMKHKFFSVKTIAETAPPIETSKKVRRLLEDVSRDIPVQEQILPSAVQEPNELKRMAQNKVKEYLESSQSYRLVDHLPDIGQRLRKYWSKIRTRNGNGRDLILSISAVPDNCPIHLSSATESTLNQFSFEIKHPYLHGPVKFQYVKDSHHVMLIQRLTEKGSLRDRIQATRNPLANWTKKLQSKGNPLTDKVALYGRHILEAVLFLYEQGFPPLGHIHTGNIFVDVDERGKEVCKVGGYENTLLGYKTCHKVFAHKKYSDSIDLKMFGHVIYEMSTGTELDKEVPVDSDYELVSRGSKHREKIVEVLRFIFSTSEHIRDGTTSYQNGLQQVKVHSFFGGAPKDTDGGHKVATPDISDEGSSEFQLNILQTRSVVSDEMKQLLSKVRNKKGPGGVKKMLKKLETATSQL